MQNTSVKSAVDPVCGMSLDPQTTSIKASVAGKDYYFCKDGCRQSFEENPAKYIGSECAKPRSWWGRYMARLQRATGGKTMKCH